MGYSDSLHVNDHDLAQHQQPRHAHAGQEPGDRQPAQTRDSLSTEWCSCQTGFGCVWSDLEWKCQMSGQVSLVSGSLALFPRPVK